MSRYVSMGARKPTWAAKFEARGRALIGHLLTNPTIVYDHMGTTANWLKTGSVPPTVAKDATTEGGGHLIDTGAVAGANSDLYWNNLAGAARSSMVKRPSTVPWYQAWRMNITTAIDAQAQLSGGLQDIGLTDEGVQIGIIGPQSTVSFTAQSAAQTATSSIAIALGVFEIETWGVGTTTLKFRVNGESPVSLTYGNPAVSGWAPKFKGLNGTTAASRAMVLLDHLIMSNGA